MFRLDAKLSFPMDLTFGPDGLGYITDWNNHSIRRVESDGTLTTVIGNAVEGDGAPAEADRLPEGNPVGAPGTDVELNHPTNATWLADGSMIVAAWHNNKVRHWDPTTGIVKVMAGDNYCYSSDFAMCSGDGGPASGGEFNLVRSVVVDDQQNIYVLDQVNERIRRIDNSTPRILTTYAGDGTRGYSGDGATIATAQFNLNDSHTPAPSGGLAIRGRKLYISDAQNNRIREIDLDSGNMKCVAGNGDLGYSGDGGPAIAAALNDPSDLEFGPDGLLYFADRGNNVVRAIDLASGDIQTVAGNVSVDCPPYPEKCIEASEGLPASELRFRAPTGISFDPAGNLYVVDWNNHRIVRIAK